MALQDPLRMQRDEALYFGMSSGERLWSRVGARMAQRIERAAGRTALIALIEAAPAAFREAYRRLQKD